jgi:hypothetical protein
MYLMMRHVFDELGYRRYAWQCNSLNVRSRAAALLLLGPAPLRRRGPVAAAVMDLAADRGATFHRSG